MKFFRKHIESKMTKGIALMIILIFIGWEFSSSMLQSKKSWLIKVGEVEYKAKDWQDTYKALTNDPLSAQEALANPLYAKKRVLDELIKNALILQEAQSLGFSVSDKMVASEVVHMKMFHGDDGKFDKARFEKLLKMNNLTEIEFMKNMREQMTRHQLMDIFYNTSGIMGGPTYDLLAKLLAAEQNIVLYKVPAIKDKIEHTDDDLKKYLQENPQYFTTDDTAKISTLLFTADLVGEDHSKHSEEEINDYYEQHAQVDPERRVVNQIVVMSYNEASQLLEKISAGQITYDSAAANYAQHQMIPYEIGPFVAEGFDDDIAKVVFSLPEGGVSGLVQSPLGWHIFRVKQIMPTKRKDLAETRNEVLQALTARKLSEKMQQLIKTIMQDIESDTSLEDLASKFNLKIQQSIEQGKRLPNGMIDVLAVQEDAKERGIVKRQMLMAAFNESEPKIKLLLSADSKSFMLLRVDETIPGRLMDFDEAKDRLSTQYTKDQIDRRTRNLAQDFRGKILASNEYAAEQIQSQAMRFSRINKNDALPECVRDLIVKLYTAGVFNGATVPCEHQSAYYFALLKDIDFNVNLSDEKKAAMKPTIHSVYNEMIFGQFIESLKKKYKVQLDEQFINYLKEQ